MAVKLRISKNSLVFRILKNPWGRVFIVTFLLLGITATGIFSFYYFRYSRMIEAELRAGPFSSATLLYVSEPPLTPAACATVMCLKNRMSSQPL